MTRSLLLLAMLREPAIRANAMSVAVLCDSSVPELFNVSRLTEVLSRQPSLQVAVVSTKEHDCAWWGRWRPWCTSHREQSCP
jgi:hypothetical protein